MAREKFSESLDTMLPTEATRKGYGLTWYNPAFQQEDPTVLSFRGREVFLWNYNPSMTEVWEKIRELESV
ncbi:hypothetical protein ES703_10299 [subsurface metagenome]